jgi:hypothetical protein
VSDVSHRRQAEGVVHEVLGAQPAQRLGVAHDCADVAPAGLHDAARDAVGLGVNGGGVERLGAVADAQEAGALLEGLGAEARHLQQRFARGEGALRVAMRHDGRGERRAETGHMREQRGGGHVEVDADRVHRILHHRRQRLRQASLIDVVLVLSDADRLRRHLHEFRQRVLKAAGDGDGTAQRHVKIGELAVGELRGGINRGAGLRDDHLGRALHLWRQ